MLKAEVRVPASPPSVGTQHSAFSIVSTSSVAALSGLYDFIVGAFLLLASDTFAALFNVAPARPPIFSDLNGLFLVTIGIGYYLPWREPERYRGYLWVMGPLLKGGGALAFLLDYFYRGSPRSFLLFAASDGALALLTLYALAGRERSRK
jgi:hypothetical protein